MPFLWLAASGCVRLGRLNLQGQPAPSAWAAPCWTCGTRPSRLTSLHSSHPRPTTICVAGEQQRDLRQRGSETTCRSTDECSHLLFFSLIILPFLSPSIDPPALATPAGLYERAPAITDTKARPSNGSRAITIRSHGFQVHNTLPSSYDAADGRVQYTPDEVPGM